MKRILKYFMIFFMCFLLSNTIQAQTAKELIQSGLDKEKSNDLSGAISDYTKAITLEPNNFHAYLNRGNAFFKSKALKSAIADYDKAISLSPKNVNAYLNRALAKYQLNDFNGAIIDYNNIIAINPKLGVAYLGRGNAKDELKDRTDACTDWHKAAELGENKANETIEHLCK